MYLIEDAQDRIPKVFFPSSNREERERKVGLRPLAEDCYKGTERGLSWAQAKAKEQDRTQWQGIITALCPSRDDEVSKKVSKTQNKEDKRVEKRKRKKSSRV